MRNALLIFLVSFLTGISFAEDYQFSESDYTFRPKHPVYVFDVQDARGSETFRVCYATFLRSRDGRLTAGAAATEDVSECSRVDSFGGNEIAFTRSALLAGWTKLGGAKGAEDEQVKIKGKIWTLTNDPKGIFRFVGTDKDGKLQYAKICRLQLRPLERRREDNAPEKAIFCKPLGPATVQAFDEDFKPKFRDGKPVMFETVVCPLPSTCIKPEWEVTPSMRIMPEVDNTTAHAGLKDPAIVHVEPKPMAP